MKYLFTLIFFLNSTAYAQELSYSIYLHDACKDSTYKAPYFRIISEKEEFNPHNGLECINGTCKVANTGTYKLLLIANVGDLPTRITLDEYKA